MPEQANAPLRVMTSESSWRCHRSYVGKANQVRHARAFVARALEGFPMVDDAVLLISELCANAVQHSKSGKPGGLFTVHAEVHEDQYVWAEVGDCGGLWAIKDYRADGRGHGLDIVREIASDWGRDGDPVTGWVVWFRLDWPAIDVASGTKVARSGQQAS
jgi:serine/threonine-protein kinase RsbW